MKLARVLAVMGLLLAASWLAMLLIVYVAELASRPFWGPLRSVVGLVVFLLFVAALAAAAEYFRRRVILRLVTQ